MLNRKEELFMKLRKKIMTAACVTFLLAGVSGCGSEEETVVIDIDGLVTELTETVMTDDILTEIDGDYMSELYGISEELLADYHVLLSSGATANEIAVFECNETTGVEAVQSGIETRIQDQIDSYSSYGPQEVPKLESAEIYVQGTYVADCVSSDNAKTDEIMKDSRF